MEGSDLEVPQADSPGAAYLWFVTTVTQTATQTTPQGNCPAVCYFVTRRRDNWVKRPGRG